MKAWKDLIRDPHRLSLAACQWELKMSGAERGPHARFTSPLPRGLTFFTQHHKIIVKTVPQDVQAR